jgi:hypothetical protein
MPGSHGYRKLRTGWLPVLLLCSTMLVGCGPVYYRAGIVAGPPALRVTGPIGIAPGPGYVWTDGYYDLRDGNWIWIDGRWVRPPRPRAVWIRPYWEPHRRGYRFHRGRWR